MAVDDLKKALRGEAERRRGRAAAENPDAGERLAGHFIDALSGFDVPGAVISGYWPMGDEMDVRPLLDRLDGLGRALALPVVGARAEPLTFRRWRPGEDLSQGVFGTRHPGGVEEVLPGVVIVPMLAFDEAGGRLGWGAGFYDRTLAQHRAQGPVAAVGVAFAAQRFDAVPQDATDEALDWIVTERGAARARR